MNALSTTTLECKDGLTGSHIAEYSAASLSGLATVTDAAGISTAVESVGWLSTEQTCADLKKSLAQAKSVSVKQSFYQNLLSSDGSCELYKQESLQLVNEKNETLLSGIAESTKQVSPKVCSKVPASKRIAL
jgi:hypothetical protein